MAHLTVETFGKMLLIRIFSIRHYRLVLADWLLGAHLAKLTSTVFHICCFILQYTKYGLDIP